MTTEIATVSERAIKALDVNEAALRALVLESAEISTVTNSAGYAQAQAARMKLRTARISVEKLGKGARDDANAFSKAVIEQEKKYIAIVSPEEVRLQSVQDEYTAKIEAEKQAKIDAENDRKAAIQVAIVEMDADLKFGDSSAEIQRKIDRVESVVVDAETFQERIEEAAKHKAESLEELRTAYAQVKSAEQAKADQEAAAEILRKQAETDRAAREQAEREAEAARAEAEAVAKAERDRLAEVAQKQAEEQRAEEKRLAEVERAKLEKQQQEERAKRITAEKETARLKAEAQEALDKKAAEDAAKAEAERKAAAAPDKERMLDYAEKLLALTVPVMSTADGISAANGIEQAVLSLHKRIIAKAEEL